MHTTPEGRTHVERYRLEGLNQLSNTPEDNFIITDWLCLSVIPIDTLQRMINFCADTP